MFCEGLNAPLLAVLQRPDLRIVAAGRSIRFSAELARPFSVTPDGAVTLGAPALGPHAFGHASGSARTAASHLRHALELSLLTAHPDGRPTGICPALACLAAGRVAARFATLDADPPAPSGPAAADVAANAAAEPDPSAAPLGALERDAPPDDAEAQALLNLLSPTLQSRPDAIGPASLERLRTAWTMLDPVELLLGTGGDARLLIDPQTRLNHYGCSHRPRPWAVTYASSTASSLSERGFAGAEAARTRLLLGALGAHSTEGADPIAHPRGTTPREEAAAIRRAIARHYGLPDTTGIVLAASGTDCELVALTIAARGAAQGAAPDATAAADLGPASPRLTNVLTAPDETGSGVPLAAIGRHFASDTSRGAEVDRGEPIAGMPVGTARADIAVRRPDGSPLPPDAIDRDAEAVVERALEGGGRVLLHLLDVSKTGLLAPSIECVARIARRGRERVDIVVDACQARLTETRVRSYSDIGWMVLLTGSKFFTGPPFCGAVLIPGAMMRRLQDAPLPEGMADYSGQADWPEAARSAASLSETVNIGMVLRWHAAVAEMRAFADIPAERIARILERFTGAVRNAIDANPDLVRIETPPLRRPVLGDAEPCWDRIQTIIAFLAVGPDGRPLGLEPARRLYRWLNADVTAHLPQGLGAQDRFLAALRCHIGQPAPVADGSGGLAGALRISAGARLVSGEPSHDGIAHEQRIMREIADAQACLDKVSLLLRHLDRLQAADPQPSFGAPPPV